MTKNQFYNIYYFQYIMLTNYNILHISPDYLKEKSLLFLGKLGKNEFIKTPDANHMHPTQKQKNFWKKYCKLWNIEDDQYDTMNIFNFLTNASNNPKKSLNNFEKYFGKINEIPNLELKHFIHKNLLNYIDNVFFDDKYSRFFKLKILE